MSDVQNDNAEQINAVDSEIEVIRGQTELPTEEAGRRLEPLYKKKSAILGGRYVDRGEAGESVEEEIHKVRHDSTLSDEKRGEKLVQLYRKRLQISQPQQEAEREEQKEEFEKARQEATTQEISLEVVQATFDEVARLETARGEDFEENSKIIAEQGLKFFRGDKQRLYDFIEDNNLARDPEALADAREFLLKQARRK